MVLECLLVTRALAHYRSRPAQSLGGQCPCLHCPDEAESQAKEPAGGHRLRVGRMKSACLQDKLFKRVGQALRKGRENAVLGDSLSSQIWLYCSWREKTPLKTRRTSKATCLGRSAWPSVERTSV